MARQVFVCFHLNLFIYLLLNRETTSTYLSDNKTLYQRLLLIFFLIFTIYTSVLRVRRARVCVYVCVCTNVFTFTSVLVNIILQIQNWTILDILFPRIYFVPLRTSTFLES